MLVCFYYAPFPIHFPATKLEKAEQDSSHAWVPAIHFGDSHGDPGSWINPGPLVAFIVVWEENEQMGDLFFPLPLIISTFLIYYNYYFQMNK